MAGALGGRELCAPPRARPPREPRRRQLRAVGDPRARRPRDRGGRTRRSCAGTARRTVADRRFDGRQGRPDAGAHHRRSRRGARVRCGRHALDRPRARTAGRGGRHRRRAEVRRIPRSPRARTCPPRRWARARGRRRGRLARHVPRHSARRALRRRNEPRRGLGPAPGRAGSRAGRRPGERARADRRPGRRPCDRRAKRADGSPRCPRRRRRDRHARRRRGRAPRPLRGRRQRPAVRDGVRGARPAGRRAGSVQPDHADRRGAAARDRGGHGARRAVGQARDQTRLARGRGVVARRRAGSRRRPCGSARAGRGHRGSAAAARQRDAVRAGGLRAWCGHRLLRAVPRGDLPGRARPAHDARGGDRGRHPQRAHEPAGVRRGPAAAPRPKPGPHAVPKRRAHAPPHAPHVARARGRDRRPRGHARCLRLVRRRDRRRGTRGAPGDARSGRRPAGVVRRRELGARPRRRGP